MKNGISIAVALACVLFASQDMRGQSQLADPAQNKPADPQQQPAKPPAQSNPFPEDTTNVPVMPSSGSAIAEPASSGSAAAPSEDSDPVRSPDDPVDMSGDSSGESSSNFSGMDRITRPPDADLKGKNKKGQQAPEHQETAAEDETVGEYYLSKHNWKAALSRYESAAVLDPENPEVYWGMGEAQRHLGDLAAAKASYQKLLDYDPNSRHGKEAKKILKDPELASAPSASAAKP